MPRDYDKELLEALTGELGVCSSLAATAPTDDNIETLCKELGESCGRMEKLIARAKRKIEKYERPAHEAQYLLFNIAEKWPDLNKSLNESESAHKGVRQRVKGQCKWLNSVIGGGLGDFREGCDPDKPTAQAARILCGVLEACENDIRSLKYNKVLDALLDYERSVLAPGTLNNIYRTLKKVWKSFREAYWMHRELHDLICARETVRLLEKKYRLVRRTGS